MRLPVHRQVYPAFVSSWRFIRASHLKGHVDGPGGGILHIVGLRIPFLKRSPFAVYIHHGKGLDLITDNRVRIALFEFGEGIEMVRPTKVKGVLSVGLKIIPDLGHSMAFATVLRHVFQRRKADSRPGNTAAAVGFAEKAKRVGRLA